MSNYTPNEMMTVAAARALRNEDVCFVGIGMPSAAANLARLTHAPDITLIYESGTLGTKPSVLPLSIGDRSEGRRTWRASRTPRTSR
jgi:glutaconate CoA-transferase subunit B